MKESAGTTFHGGVTRVALDNARQASLGGALGSQSIDSFLLVRSPWTAF